jgi:hypothetical protein
MKSKTFTTNFGFWEDFLETHADEFHIGDTETEYLINGKKFGKLTHNGTKMVSVTLYAEVQV